MPRTPEARRRVALSGSGRAVPAGLLVVALSLLAACGSDYAMRATIADLQRSALADDTAWRLLASLTTDVGPRMAGSEGDKLAVEWARTRFETLEFDRVWLEPVTFPRWVRRDESALVVTPRRQPLAVTALGGSPGTDGTLGGEVVRFADIDALRAADPGSMVGKIAFIAARMTRSRSGAGYGDVVKGRSEGPFVAADKGAVALVIRSVGTGNDRLPHTGMISSAQPGRAVPSAAISNPDADLLEALIDAGEPVRLALTLDCGFDGTAQSWNVIGELEGRQGGDEFVVIGAHLDAWDLGTGAHDDGAGVAITMAAAKLVADLPQRPRRGIRVVLFANEEQGIHGGRAYARRHASELSRHVIGAESDLGAGRIYQFRSRVRESAEPAMEELAAYLRSLNIPRQLDRPATGGADLGQMRKLGMPVVDLNHDATRYFDLHHTANDTLDKVDAADLRFNVAAYATFVYFAAETDAEFGPVAASE